MSTFRLARHGNFPLLSGKDTVSLIREFSARQPFQTYSASWNLLSSHDSARVRTIVGGHDRQRVAIAFAMTMPGTPMIFAGDEIGAEGSWGEDSRSPFPWNGESPRDDRIREVYRDLIRLRKDSDALINGGLQWLEIGEDHLLYVRESERERLATLLARTAGEFKFDFSVLESAGAERLLGDSVQLDGATLIASWSRPGFAILRLR